VVVRWSLKRAVECAMVVKEVEARYGVCGED